MDECVASEKTRGKPSGYNNHGCRCWKCTTAICVARRIQYTYKPRPANARRPGGFIDLTGRSFGDVIVLARAPNAGEKLTWLVRCKHGTEYVAYRDALVRGGDTYSCRIQCPFCPAGHDTRVVGRRGTACTECASDYGSKYQRKYRAKYPEQLYLRSLLYETRRKRKRLERRLATVGLTMEDVLNV